MELQLGETEMNGSVGRQKGEKTVSIPRIESKFTEKGTTTANEVPSVYLSPEQIEEIHVDEYSLMLFYATRIEPLSLLEIKRKYPEQEAKKAQSVMDRFLKAELIHITREGKYYSNYPENYINYSQYRYDSDLEARKDGKVFQTMKEQTKKSIFWQDKFYFSIDAFFSEEQSEELLDLLKEFRRKAKIYSNENMKSKSVGGLKFRRIKLYDMFFSMLFAVLCGFGFSSESYAGGNDPTGAAKANFVASSMAVDDALLLELMNPGGGHDPGGDPTNKGGGHDPSGGGGGTQFRYIGDQCFAIISNQVVPIDDPRFCTIQNLHFKIKNCEVQSNNCEKLYQEFDQLNQELSEF